jgi:hypothetical protein
VRTLGFIVRHELAGESFVEGDGCSLGRGVVNHARGADITSKTCDGNNHAVVVGDHVG